MALTTPSAAPLELEARGGIDFSTGEINFIGNATTLVRYGGFTILTDPTFLHQGEYVHLGHGAYARRQVGPALDIDELPELDLVVLSHHHGDHFDDVAARELDKDLPILTTPHAVGLLEEQGFTRGQPLDTWESQTVVKGDARLTVTSLPAKHAPDPFRGLLPPTMGSMLEFSEGDDHQFRLYISGDTLVHDRLHDIPKRYPDIDLGMFHVGGTTLLGVMVTMDGDQGIEAIRTIDPDTAIPIHYNDYSVFHSDLNDVKAAAEEARPRSTMRYLEHGDTYHFQPTGRR